MRRIHRIVLLAALIGAAPVLSGCENFDLDKFDVFNLNQKKKLPGERRPLFPGGVPGVSQGVPPEYLQGHEQEQPGAAIAMPAAPQPAATDAAKTAAVAPGAPVAPAKPAVKPKPKRIAKPKAKTKTAAPAAAPAPQPAAQQQNMPPWPGAAPAQPPPQGTAAPWPSTQQNDAAWPASPPPGTFSR